MMSDSPFPEDTREELRQLWESVVEKSFVFLFKLADTKVDLTAEVPGLKVVVQDGDLYAVEVPEKSMPAFTRLDDAGKLPNPTADELRRLEQLLAERDKNG